MRASKGVRRGTRRKFSNRFRKKFLLRAFLQEFKPHDRVVIDIDPTYHKTMPYSKFKGLVGVIKGKKGDAYIVEVKTGKKRKTIIAGSEHLKLIKH